MVYNLCYSSFIFFFISLKTNVLDLVFLYKLKFLATLEDLIKSSSLRKFFLRFSILWIVLVLIFGIRVSKVIFFMYKIFHQGKGTPSPNE
jgi:hypothetical protein